MRESYLDGGDDCEAKTENLALFTFDARRLTSENGKVTHVSVTVTETAANQIQHNEESLSIASISLKEKGGVGGESPIVSQVGAVIPWLVTDLVWTAQGLILGLPLCFASLGIVVLVDRGVVPTWKKSLAPEA